MKQDFNLVYKYALISEYDTYRYGGRWLEFGSPVKDECRLLVKGTYISLAVL